MKRRLLRVLWGSIIISTYLLVTTLPVMAIQPKGVKVFTIDFWRSEYIGSESRCGLQVGTAFPALNLIDIAGRRVNLHNIKQKLLVAYEERPEELSPNTDFYEEMALLWKGKLQIVILYLTRPSKASAERLQKAGVIIVPNFQHAERYLHQRQEPFVYLLDEKKVIQCSYRYCYYDKKIFSDLVADFVLTTNIQTNAANVDIVTIGEQVKTIHSLQKLNGEVLRFEELCGRPTIIVFKPNDEVIPVLKALVEKYTGKVNQIAIRGYLTDTRIQEYIELQKSKGLGYENVLGLSYTQVQQLMSKFESIGNGLQVTLDENGFFHYLFNVLNPNTVVILDENLTMVQGFVLAPCVYQDEKSAREAVKPEVEIGHALERLL